MKSSQKIKAAVVAGNRFSQLIADLTPLEIAKTIQALATRGETIKQANSRKYWLQVLVNALTAVLSEHAEMLANEQSAASSRGRGTEHSPESSG